MRVITGRSLAPGLVQLRSCMYLSMCRRSRIRNTLLSHHRFISLDLIVRCLSTLSNLFSGTIMHMPTSARLHCGCVDIGHAHSGLWQRAFAHSFQAPGCKLPEGSLRAFFGQTAALKAGKTCSGSLRHARQRSAVQTSAVFGFLRGDAAEKTRKKYQAQVDAINRLEPQMQKLSDQQLADKTQQLKQKAQQNGGVDDLLVEAFAVGSCAVAPLLHSLHKVFLPMLL